MWCWRGFITLGCVAFFVGGVVTALLGIEYDEKLNEWSSRQNGTNFALDPKGHLDHARPGIILWIVGFVVCCGGIALHEIITAFCGAGGETPPDEAATTTGRGEEKPPPAPPQQPIVVEARIIP